MNVSEKHLGGKFIGCDRWMSGWDEQEHWLVKEDCTIFQEKVEEAQVCVGGKEVSGMLNLRRWQDIHVLL